MKQNGMVLVAVMTFLFILTLLGLGATDASLLAIKESQQQWQFWQSRQWAILINRNYIKEIQKQLWPGCMISWSQTDNYWRKTVSFWQTQTACILTSNYGKAFTTIETYPEKFCHQTTELSLYRLTSFVQSKTHALFLVQSTLTVPTSPIKTCDNALSQLSLGLQSWRME